MPKIRITEQDLTGIVTSVANNNIVYIPTIVTRKVEKKDAEGQSVFVDLGKETILYKSKGLFEKEFFNEQPTSDDVGVIMADKLLGLGLYVLIDTGFEFSGSETDIKALKAKLEDKTKVDVRFLTAGGLYGIFPGDDGTTLNRTLIEIASKRGDAIALVDYSKAPEETEDLVKYIRDYVDTKLLPEDTDVKKIAKYAAMFAPYITISSDKITRNIDNKQHLEVPGSYGYLLAYGKAIQKNPTWFATAGTLRGVIPDLVSIEQEFSEAECDVLGCRVGLDEPGDNVGMAINPICRQGDFGILVWGARTLHENKADEASGTGVGVLSASSFLNIRNACSEIKKVIYRTCKKYTFEQNTDILWFNFSSEITPLLDRMQSNQGIAGYKLTQVRTPGVRARLSARLVIVPIEPVEDFDISILLGDSLEVGE